MVVFSTVRSIGNGHGEHNRTISKAECNALLNDIHEVPVFFAVTGDQVAAFRKYVCNELS